jgi:dTDP-4-amino-4,6-dideoxygalactose transaminase
VPTPKPIPLLDLTLQHRALRQELLDEVLPLIDSQRFILGEPVERLEQEIARYCGSRNAVGCASGTDALMLALMALEVGPGDEVLTVPYTFFATAGAIVRVGARPVFVDVEPGTLTIDCAQVKRVVENHPKLRAIIPVHLYGACADCDPLLDLARAHGLFVIEDAAQAIGAEYKGRRAGSLGHIACFSFFPSKNLGGWGDGGMLTTPDTELAEKLRALRVHGSDRRYLHEWAGINSRLDALQAAVLRVKLRHLDEWTAARQRNADLYRRLIAPPTPVELPRVHPPVTRHVYNQFVILGGQRDQLKQYLERAGVGTEIYYPLPLHLQACFAWLGYREGEFPVSEDAARRSLALPVYPELGEHEIERVACLIANFYQKDACDQLR